ncbi:MAG: hypothetical protein JXB45_07145 [Candidatus Krumholzibacteriota bacterium]|nr:hypothetical protein [Candidatus Krumholzibacteriota bacterium]
MAVYERTITAYGLTREMARTLRNRIRGLILFSSLTVALAFGLSFYYALVSSKSAISSQFPELAFLVNQLKSALVMNTFGFAAVIIISFYVLTLLITTRIFRPLGHIQKGIIDLAGNRIPDLPPEPESGPFSDFEASYRNLVSVLADRDRRDTETLSGCLEKLSAVPGFKEVKQSLEELRETRQLRLGSIPPRKSAESPTAGETEENPVFMQPG